MNSEVDEAMVLLSLKPGFTPEELRAAWKQKVSEWHPDKLGGMADELKKLATERMQKLNAAYETLKASNSEARLNKKQSDESKSTNQGGTDAYNGRRESEQRPTDESWQYTRSTAPFRQASAEPTTGSAARRTVVVLLAVVAVTSVTFYATHPTSSRSGPDTIGQSTSGQPVSNCPGAVIEAFKNRTYDINNSPLTLKGGELANTKSNSDNGYVEAGFEGATCGDLDGDGRLDAVVALYSNGGGSGGFISLVSIGTQNAARRKQSPIFALGDRVSIKEMTISNRSLVVTYMGHGPDDGLCCPSVLRTIKLKLTNNALVCADEACEASREAVGG